MTVTLNAIYTCQHINPRLSCMQHCLITHGEWKCIPAHLSILCRVSLIVGHAFNSVIATKITRKSSTVRKRVGMYCYLWIYLATNCTYVEMTKRWQWYTHCQRHVSEHYRRCPNVMFPLTQNHYVVACWCFKSSIDTKNKTQQPIGGRSVQQWNEKWRLIEKTGKHDILLIKEQLILETPTFSVNAQSRGGESNNKGQASICVSSYLTKELFVWIS